MKMERMATAENAELLTAEAKREAVTVASMLARRLQDAISAGEFAVGMSLPSERDLMQRYQVSRATVREALRNLRAQNMIEVRRGRSGGSFISEPSSTSLVQTLDRFIAGQDFRYVDLVAAREAIEPAAAAQAAQGRTDEALAYLRDCCLECENTVYDQERFVEANLKWHLALATASGNPLFIAFLTSLSTAMHTATAFEEFDLRVRKAVVGVHWQIFDAIRLGDVEAARRRTARHLNAYEEKLEAITQSALLADESNDDPGSA